MDTCEYIVQFSAEDPTCGAPATEYLPDVMTGRLVPICDKHAMYTLLPLKEWT